MIRYAKHGQRTAECFRCGFKVKLESPETRILLRTERMAEAIEAVKRYKMRLHIREPLE